jgi:hypothetical protein
MGPQQQGPFAMPAAQQMANMNEAVWLQIGKSQTRKQTGTDD